LNKKAVLIVLDSVGIGEMEDSHLYGDQGSNTLGNTAKAMGGLNLPNMQRLGLGNIADIAGVPPVEHALGAYGKMREKSKGKDTTTGHWEMMGIILDKAFPTYPQGFPAELIAELEKRIGRKTLGNIVASGTQIIEILGEEHVKTGFPIVYTSADSVLQIAAHEDIIGLDELYNICHIARDLMQGEHAVGRVIARPFIGQAGSFVRTPHRHDYSLEPAYHLLDAIIDSKLEVVGIGKIKDIFVGRAVSSSYPTKNNEDGVEKILSAMGLDFTGLIFANLIDFDQQYGHRNDVAGYAGALEDFDRMLPLITDKLNDEDILFITADHGCDPTTPSTDHSREHVPILVYGKGLRSNVNLGVRASFADLGQTIADYLGIDLRTQPGESFYPLLQR